MGGKKQEPDPPPHAARKIRENAEAVIIAIILALIIRHYSLEAFEIPTGSMAPGLHGVHVDAECPNCGTVDAVGLPVDQESNALSIRPQPGYIYDGPCPECAFPIHDNVTKPDAPVRCLRCRTTHRGDPGDYRYSPQIAREHVQCSTCTYQYFHIFEPLRTSFPYWPRYKDARPGHKILVNKFSYEASAPERWQVIVFKFNRQRNYIKRLIGLPGETIEVVDGDIHIDGAIERKPIDVQDRMWFLVHDTDLLEAGLAGPAWYSAGDFRAREGEPGLLFNALDGVAGFEYLRAIRNDVAYNGARNANSTAAPVRDIRALVDVRLQGRDAAGSPRFWVDLRNGGTVYRLSLPVGGAGGEILRLDAELAGGEYLDPDRQEPEGGGPGEWSVFAAVEGGRLDTGRSHEIDFSISDRQLRVRLDGKLLLERPTDPRDDEAGIRGPGDEPEGLERNGVAVRARHCGGRVDRIRLFRDIHYTRAGSFYVHAVNGPYQIPEDGYFAMGDNSPSSLDSRAWGALRHQNLLGRGFSIFWPALPGDFEMGFIR